MDETSSNITGSGAKRLRHGSYRTVYLDNRGHGRMGWRAEYQAIRPDGAVRLRKWFKSREDAYRWLGKV